MANAQAWQAGWDFGAKLADERRARKEQLSDEERQNKVFRWYTQGTALAKTIPSLTGEHKDKAMRALADIESNISEVYHPDNNPGALRKDWGWIRGLIHKSPPHGLGNISYDPTRTPDATITPPAQTATLGATPSYPVLQAMPPQAGATLPRAKLAGIEAGTPEQAVTLPSAQPVTIPGTTYNVRPAAAIMTPQQRQKMARRDDARRAAEIDVQAAGLSPQEEAQADSAKKMAYVRQAQKDYESLNPNATSEQKASFLANLVQQTYQFTQKPVWKEYVGPNGEKKWMDASKPEEIEPGWNATGGESADTRKRADYAAFLKTHPDYESKGGTFEQWTVERGQLAKLAVPTSRDDRYIALQQKLAEGQKLDPKEQAYVDGYDMYVKKRITGPMLARVAAQAADRYVPFVSPDDPQKVIMMPVAEGARAGLGTPQSIAFQTDKAMNKYMTSGKGGENIAFFSTAVSHLGLLNEIGMALDNGDLQTVNRLGNIIATETGGEAPTDFNAVKNAVAGEIAKVFTGRGATVEEIAQINATINNAQTPAQIKGAINYYLLTMGGKLGAVKAQAESAKPGGVARTLDAAQAAAQKTASDVTGGGGAGAAGATPTKTYKHYAKDPQTKHRIGTDDDPNSPTAKWYDVQTGKLVQ